MNEYMKETEREHSKQDVRCGCCGYMTYHREHMSCIRAAEKTVPAPAEVPMPESIERLAITRYRTRPKGMFGCEVVAGDGSRSLFEGSRTECCSIARKLAEAFLDGAHVAIAAGVAREAAGYAERGKDADRYSFLRGDGGPTSVRWSRWEVAHWTGNWNPVSGKELDAAIDAALRGR